MPESTLKFTIRGVLIAVACCALLLALVRMPGMESLMALLGFTVGPLIGAMAQRCWGGRGVQGGVIGGVVSYIGFGVVMYLLAYLYPKPSTGDYIGPVLGFLLLASIGAAIGLAVGMLVWGVMSIEERSGRP
jgi:hypothetical protein